MQHHFLATYVKDAEKSVERIDFSIISSEIQTDRLNALRYCFKHILKIFLHTFYLLFSFIFSECLPSYICLYYLIYWIVTRVLATFLTQILGAALLLNWWRSGSLSLLGNVWISTKGFQVLSIVWTQREFGRKRALIILQLITKTGYNNTNFYTKIYKDVSGKHTVNEKNWTNKFKHWNGT